jgi:hypothetical protein
MSARPSIARRGALAVAGAVVAVVSVAALAGELR